MRYFQFLKEITSPVKQLVFPFILWGVCISVSQAQLANSAWPSLKNDKKNTGLSEYSGVIAENIRDSIRWKKEINLYEFDGCLGYDLEIWEDAIQAADGTIYAGFGSMCYLYAFSSDGKLKWRKDPGPADRSAPALGKEGTIYYGGENLYALNPDGTEKWTFDKIMPQHWFFAPTVGDNGLLYAPSDVGLFAIDTGGTMKWVNAELGPVLNPAIADDGTIYVKSDTSSSVYALNPDGGLKWSYESNNDGGRRSTPSIGRDGTVYVLLKNELHAINPDSSKKWVYRFDNAINTYAQAIGPDGTIYAGANRTLYAISKEGELEQKFSRRDEINDVIIDKEGTIYLSTKKVLFAINNQFEVLWEFSKRDIEDDGEWSSPIIGANGTVFVGHVDFYALGGRKFTDIHNHRQIAEQFNLKKNYPNPFNPVTNITFAISQSEQVTIEVFDNLGRKVDVVVDRQMNAGEHTVTFNGSSLSSGIYVYRLRAGEYSDTKKMLLLK